MYLDSSGVPCSLLSPSCFSALAGNKQAMKEALSFFLVAYRDFPSLNARHPAAGTERHLPVILSSVESLLPSKMLSSLAVTSLWGAPSLTPVKKGE